MSPGEWTQRHQKINELTMQKNFRDNSANPPIGQVPDLLAQIQALVPVDRITMLRADGTRRNLTAWEQQLVTLNAPGYAAPSAD
ncbi:hypothetical protein D0962_15345 [Leptolyngbyaceae cyanobacterium CCMR0082]|uniref:Uncharacterized protein n=1 Tax=Adonisia turfae CCMR0082 TaxID=2304604 RepID=A0A6M0S6P3_9CYAN|nr:hypothetical protein [Adonisia turfae]NEZ64148.1 hypothetical protein [Adonisia turfae CCMR0082]